MGGGGGGGGGVEGLSLQPNFRKGGGLTGPPLLEEGFWKRGGDFFEGVCNLHIKNKLKSEIFKKFIGKNIFLCHN